MMKELVDALRSLIETADSAAYSMNTNQMDAEIAKARAIVVRYEQEEAEQALYAEFVSTLCPTTSIPGSNGWLPIETAPKDNKESIDLWRKSGYRAPNCVWSAARKRHGGIIQTGWTELNGSTNPESDYIAWRPQPLPPVFK